MKKLFPIRTYFVRAKVFGFIVIFIVLVYLVYLILDVSGSLTLLQSHQRRTCFALRPRCNFLISSLFLHKTLAWGCQNCQLKCLAVPTTFALWHDLRLPLKKIRLQLAVHFGSLKTKFATGTIFNRSRSFRDMVLRITFIVFLCFAAAESSGQLFKRKKQKAEAESPAQQPTSLNPSSSRSQEYAPKESRRSSKGPTYGLEQEYYERMEAVAKERRKVEKIMEKPQYSDPMYFGHKRPPKKRKPSKMKFCKVCGIRH